MKKDEVGFRGPSADGEIYGPVDDVEGKKDEREDGARVAVDCVGQSDATGRLDRRCWTSWTGLGRLHLGCWTGVTGRLDRRCRLLSCDDRGRLRLFFKVTEGHWVTFSSRSRSFKVTIMASVTTSCKATDDEELTDWTACNRTSRSLKVTAGRMRRPGQAEVMSLCPGEQGSYESGYDETRVGVRRTDDC